MEYEISLVTAVGISVLFALSLNLITGFCGQISLGHAAFFGIGAYASALLCKMGLPFLLSLPLAMLLAGGFGLVVGLASLRVLTSWPSRPWGLDSCLWAWCANRTAWAVKWASPVFPILGSPNWVSCC